MEKELINTHCPSCNHQFKVRLDTNRLKTQTAKFKCPKCKNSCQFEAELPEVVDAEYDEPVSSNDKYEGPAKSTNNSANKYGLKFPKDLISIVLTIVVGIFIVVAFTEYRFWVDAVSTGADGDSSLLGNIYLGMYDVFNPASDFYENRRLMLIYGVLTGLALLAVLIKSKVSLLRCTSILSLILFIPAFTQSQYFYDFATKTGDFEGYEEYPEVTEEMLSEQGYVDGENLVSLKVVTSPEDASVRILNIGPKYHYGMALEPGQYHIEVSKEGYQTKQFWWDLQQSDLVKVSLNKTQSSKYKAQVSTEPSLQLVTQPSRQAVIEQ